MYELWARSRTLMKYMFITAFDDQRQFHYMMDQVDRDEYSEAMILRGQDLMMYLEFKENVKRKTR